MDIDEILARDPGTLTPEEIAFLEKELLAMTRELFDAVQEIAATAEPGDPLVQRLTESAASVLVNVVAARACGEGEGDQVSQSS